LFLFVLGKSLFGKEFDGKVCVEGKESRDLDKNTVVVQWLGSGGVGPGQAGASLDSTDTLPV